MISVHVLRYSGMDPPIARINLVVSIHTSMLRAITSVPGAGYTKANIKLSNMASRALSSAYINTGINKVDEFYR